MTKSSITLADMLYIFLHWLLLQPPVLSFAQPPSLSAEEEKAIRRKAFQVIKNPAFKTQAQGFPYAAAEGEGCSGPLPEIKSHVVFQSVEAPQIKPLRLQEGPPFKSYDLVWKKPAGVLVDLRQAGIKNQELFALGLMISSPARKLFYSRCFHRPLEEEKLFKGRETPCVFTQKYLNKTGPHKFLPLPMSGLPPGETKVSLLLFPKIGPPKCAELKSFSLNIIKTKNPKLGFIRVVNSSECSDALLSSRAAYDFARSKEVQNHIPSMFPAAGIEADVVSYAKEGKVYDYIETSCSPLPLFNRISTILSILFLQVSLPYDHLIGISSAQYVKKLIGPRAVGVALAPKLSLAIFYESLPMHMAIVSAEEKNSSTVAHEIGHLFGQSKDFYKFSNKCQRFKNRPGVPCTAYTIPLALDAQPQYWRFVKYRRPIMNSSSHLTVWIDRETYQKNFSALMLETAAKGQQLEILKSIAKQTPRIFYRSFSKADFSPSPPKAVISGFYSESKNAFIAQTKVLEKNIAAASYTGPAPSMTFQLKNGKTLLQEIRRPLIEYNMESFYKNGKTKTEPFPFAQATAGLSLPRNYQEKNLKILVFNPKGRLVYETPVPKKSEKIIKIDNLS